MNEPLLPIDRRVGAPDSRTLKERLLSVVFETDTTGTKVTLMMYAAFQALGFFFNRGCAFIACEFLRDAMSYYIWGALFGVYAILKCWRIFDGRSRPTLAKVINGSGVFLFGGFAVALLVARWPSWVLAVPNVVLAFAAIWVFARTAINPERGFRAD
jgi:hypothetical protein